MLPRERDWEVFHATGNLKLMIAISIFTLCVFSSLYLLL